MSAEIGMEPNRQEAERVACNILGLQEPYKYSDAGRQIMVLLDAKDSELAEARKCPCPECKEDKDWANSKVKELTALLESSKVREGKMREALLELKHQSHHLISEEMWRIDSALADGKGEV